MIYRACVCRSVIDYIYGTWWRCRNCGCWIDKTPKTEKPAK